MGGDPRMMQAWLEEYHGDEIRDELAEIKRRLQYEKANAGPVDDTGPIVRLVAAILRRQLRTALRIACALDRHFGLYGTRLAGEPDGNHQ
ncbi:hypothetical protein JYU07_00735 [Roseiflexus sp. AH-315-K22]|nr:hypothetical protein [Roseiflexus sp. AH-315-K22]